jgi:2-hydroxy-6-oxonona-2,4-dienedioate hydrolase
MIITYPIRTNGHRSRIIEAGAGPREIWLVHGIGGRADRWRSCMELLAESGYRVRALDLPGHGFASRAAGSDYTVAEFSAFVLDTLITNVEGSPTALIGTSFGGQAALRAALDLHALPDAPQLDALVLCAPTGVWPLGPALRNGLAARLPQADRDALRARLRFTTQLAGADLEAMIEEEFRTATFPGTPEAFAQIATMVSEELDADPLVEPLSELAETLPVLLVWGEHDRSVPPEIGERISRRVPKVSSILLPGAGHMPYIQQPEIFCGQVLRFLRDLDSAA